MYMHVFVYLHVLVAGYRLVVCVAAAEANGGPRAQVPDTEQSDLRRAQQVPQAVRLGQSARRARALLPAARALQSDSQHLSESRPQCSPRNPVISLQYDTLARPARGRGASGATVECGMACRRCSASGFSLASLPAIGVTSHRKGDKREGLIPFEA